MSKRIRAKYKIDRRLECNLWGRPKSPYNTRQYRPGQHGQRRTKPTDFGVQLMAKQKLKGYYGNIGEKKFRRYYVEASRRSGDAGENLIGLLETRLDTIVYRAKFVPTVFAARQLVNHGHVTVNGKRVNIASYTVKLGDRIALRDKARDIPMVIEALASVEREVPDFIAADLKKCTAEISRVPLLDEVPYPTIMQPNLVIEYYSR
ncbi:MAG: 30S ribosomal protein S4 [Pseudomonadota bacterium]